MNSLSIKQKIAFSLIFTVVFASLLIAGINFYRFSNNVEQRVVARELPATMKYIAAEVDKEIKSMQMIARQIATDPLILDWNERGQSAQGEALLIRKLARIAQQNDLSAASFADRQSAKYWNEDGFLRQLKDDERDGWFFAYTQSGEADMVSTYRYENGTTDLFVNYQQVDGRGLSGTAKSFESVIDFLNGFSIEQSGFIYLVDATGKVQIHQDPGLLQTVSLSDLYNPQAAKQLLNDRSFALQEVEYKGETYLIASSYIPSMGWYAVAQVPKQEIFAGVKDMLIESTIWTLLVTAVIAVLGWLLAARLTRPIVYQAQLFQRLGQGDADLSYRLPENGEHEVATMARGYNMFATKLQAVLAAVKQDSQQVRELSASLRRDAESTMQSCQETDDNVSHMSAAMSQMNSAVAEIAESAGSATQSAQEVDRNRDEIAHVITQSREDIASLAEQINDVASVIANLNDNTETIAGVLEVIQSISDQTNLLALNAAIEAARAGEQGRGFSVVADEVRSLAQKTADSTLEIQGIIEKLRTSATSVSAEIGNIVDGSQKTSASILQAESILSANKAKFAQILDISHQIAVATEQQSYSIKDINDNMASISELSGANMRSVANITERTLKLTALAEQVDQQVDQFKSKS